MPDPCDCPVFSFHDILERLDTAQRMFPKDQENPNEGGWQENSSRRRVDRAHSRLRFKRSTYLSGNAALTKGIYVVAMGWRCAYLVDTVGIKKEQLEILGGCFGSNASLQHIAFLFEETFEQVYVINIPIFKARATTLQTFCHTKSLSNAEMLWVQVDQGLPSMVCEMPMSLRVQILKHFDLNRNIAVPIPSGGLSEETSPGLMRIKVNRTDLPSLSAWILEYSVGYTFSQNIPVQAGETARRRNGDAKEKVSGMGKTNLDGEPLVLIKVKISGVKALGDNYNLLAFSYPAKLLESSDRSDGGSIEPSEIHRWLDELPKKLKEHYGGRLQKREDGIRPVIDVSFERVRLEKVVL